MKTNPAITSLLSLGLAWFAVHCAQAEPVRPAAAPLHVTIDTLEPIEFRHARLARADGNELILTTLKQTAADQVRWAKYPGAVVVLDEKAAPPAGAPVLRLTWTAQAVVADLLPANGAKPVNLGVVSSTPLTNHPDFDRMYAEITRHGQSDLRRDAELRARTQMNLYLALQRAGRVLKP